MPIKRARGRKKEETEARLPLPIDRLACSLARSSLCLEGSGIMGRINMQGYATYVRILRMGAKGLLLGEPSRAEPSKTRPNAERRTPRAAPSRIDWSVFSVCLRADPTPTCLMTDGDRPAEPTLCFALLLEPSVRLAPLAGDPEAPCRSAGRRARRPSSPPRLGPKGADQPWLGRHAIANRRVLRVPARRGDRGARHLAPTRTPDKPPTLCALCPLALRRAGRPGRRIYAYYEIASSRALFCRCFATP